MFSKDKKVFLPRQSVYQMLTRENEYASKWEKDKESQCPPFPDHAVSRETGNPFTLMEWLVFAEKYLDEAKLAYANYCPDLGAVRIRFIKAAALLVTALQVHGEPEDLERLAGVSSNQFPVLHGGLKTFEQLREFFEGEMERRFLGDESDVGFDLGKLAAAPKVPANAEEPIRSRSCNRHTDCDAAEAAVLARNPGLTKKDIGYSFHCHSEDCDECFGN